MSKPVIGILTWRQGHRFSEPSYLRRLIREGTDLGATVYLFAHNDIMRQTRQIRGYLPTTPGGWTERIFPWPDIVIDRCRRGDKGYSEVRNSKLFIYANNKYTNKWNATNLFLREDSLKKWIPKTVEYNPSNLKAMIKKHPMLYIKPGNGTGGRSIVKLSISNKGFTVLGRGKNYAKKKLFFPSESLLLPWLNRWAKQERIREGNFMIQQGLDLELVPKRVADTRLLIQKDEQGKWTVTGLGVRVGGENSSTSNLHGGGKAVLFEQLIGKRFGPEKTASIRKECDELAHQVVKVIEKHFGSMMEFGLDIGVDVNGRVWLIEVNPKPGRDIFKGIGSMKLYKLSVQRPIQYAMYLAEKRKKEKEEKEED